MISKLITGQTRNQELTFFFHQLWCHYRKMLVKNKVALSLSNKISVSWGLIMDQGSPNFSKPSNFLLVS